MSHAMPQVSEPPARLRAAALLCLLLGHAAPMARAAGFEVFDQGARPAGLAGAFVAQASDPTAVFYNPGGLALLEKKKAVTAGVAVAAFNESLYQGLPPGPGTATTGEQETPLATVPHAFLTLPFGDRMVVGLGAFSPFRLHTEWAHAATYAGRFQATESEIVAYDLAPTLGLAVTPKLGVGVGAVYRSSELSVSRRLAGQNPFTGSQVDIASLAMKSDYEAGFGWSAGVLHRPTPSLSWGLSYRSAIAIDYIGVGRLTQISTGNAQLDQLVRAGLPFDQDLALVSGIEYPDQATLGVAWSPSRPILVELDLHRTGWGSLREVALRFPSNPEIDTANRLDFRDSSSYRVGARYKLATGPQLRVGYARDQTPQPAEAIGAFLPDADRNVLSVGAGLDWLDVAFVWTTYEQRIVFDSAQGLNGNYRANAWMLTISATK
jgi:long-chain fatty acid transport protein